MATDNEWHNYTLYMRDFVSNHHQRYLVDLNDVILKIVNPVRERKLEVALCETLLASVDVLSLFETLTILERVQRYMHVELSEAVSKPRPATKEQCFERVTDVAEIFLLRIPQLAMYGRYSQQLVATEYYIDQMRKRGNLREMLQAFEQKLKPRFDLSKKNPRSTLPQYLDIPLRILGSYVDFYRHIYTCGKLEMVEKSLRLCVDLQSASGQCQEDMRSKLRIEEMQTEIDQLPRKNGKEIKLSDYGSYVYAARVKVKYHHHIDFTSRYLLMLQSVIVVLKENEAARHPRYLYRDMIDLRVFFDGKTFSKKFQIELYEQRNTKVLRHWIIKCDDRAGFDAWKKALNSVLPMMDVYTEDVKKCNYQTFTSGAGAVCDYCHFPFKGMTMQSCRCPHCFKVLHKECIRHAPVCKSNNTSASAQDFNIRLFVEGLVDNWYEDYTWFVGGISAQQAAQNLQRDICTVGTFSVRSQIVRNTNQYFITIKLDTGRVSDMPVHRSMTNSFFLSHPEAEDDELFDCVPDLVLYYKMKPLKLTFPDGHVVSLGLNYHDVMPKPEENEDRADSSEAS